MPIKFSDMDAILTPTELTHMVVALRGLAAAHIEIASELTALATGLAAAASDDRQGICTLADAASRVMARLDVDE